MRVEVAVAGGQHESIPFGGNSLRKLALAGRVTCALALWPLLGAPVWGAEGSTVVERPPVERKASKWKKAWTWSAAALMASVAADTASSMGRTELNPLLRGPAGQFNARSAALKFSIAGALVGSQYLFLRKHPEQAAWAAAGNFAAAGLTAGVAVRNYRIPK